MAKQVLVIGGSYFVGRVFSILCSRDEEFELHVVNRGKAPIRKEDLGIHEYRSDRHDIDTLRLSPISRMTRWWTSAPMSRAR